MSSKSQKIIYWVATLFLVAIMMFSASMYFLKHEMVKELFEGYGYPSYIIYPLAIAKILGLIAILCKKSETLKEWAFAGFFFDTLLALSAHVLANDGSWTLALIALIATLVSYYFDKKVFQVKNS